MKRVAGTAFYLLFPTKSSQMKIEQIEIRVVKLPIHTPFKVSFGTFTDRVLILVKLFSDEFVGYGECASFKYPAYVTEFTAAEYLIIKDFIAPLILGKEFADAQALKDVMDGAIKGHNFAKAAVESAYWHLLSLKENRSLKSLFGGVRDQIPVGESLGIKDSIEETLEEVAHYVAEGSKRIKVKIQQGWDVQVAQAIREQYPDISLMLDGNSDYRLEHKELLKSLDQFDLLMLEQPLAYNDIVDHSILQAEMDTPICLDESILDLDDARKALYLKSCKTINIKPGRVGGPLMSMAIHDYCQEQDIPVWCGGLLETGIGRAFNIALASLPNYLHPADMSETKIFYNEDLVDNPYSIVNGMIDVPDTPGLGFSINDARIEKYTIQMETLRPE